MLRRKREIDTARRCYPPHCVFVELYDDEEDFSSSPLPLQCLVRKVKIKITAGAPSMPTPLLVHLGRRWVEKGTTTQQGGVYLLAGSSLGRHWVSKLSLGRKRDNDPTRRHTPPRWVEVLQNKISIQQNNEKNCGAPYVPPLVPSHELLVSS